MVYRFAAMVLFFLLSTLSSPCFAKIPMQFAPQSQQLKKYRESGQYIKAITQVTQRAEQYLRKAILKNNQAGDPHRLAIVLGINETALSNFYDIGKSELSKGQLQTHDKPALVPVLNFYRFARQHHIAIFFITRRPESGRKQLIKNLKDTGYYNWQGLYMLPQDYQVNSQVPFKVDARKHITNQGYTIVLTLGDQATDLEGPYTGRKFKLPNPFYEIQ